MKLNGINFATAAFMTLLASEALAGDCTINGVPSINSTISNPVKTSTDLRFAGNVCGNSIYASSGTCYLRIDNDDSVASGDCLTVGKGVVITVGTNHTLTCTGPWCGAAIKASTSGSGNTTIDGLEVKGCWWHGIETITTNDNYKNLTVDLTNLSGDPWCTQSWKEAIYGSPNLIEDSDIIGGDTNFVGCLQTSGTVKNSTASHCWYGLEPAGSTVVENVMFYNNRVTIYNGGGVLAKGVHVVAGPDTYLDFENDDAPCHCYGSGGCHDMASCFDFGSPPSFVDDALRQ